MNNKVSMWKKELYQALLKDNKLDTSMRKHRQSLAHQTLTVLNEWNGQPINHKNPNKIQVMDLFCGCGGMTAGFAALSQIFPCIKVIGGCDIEKDAIKTYEKNYNAPGIIQDVRELVESTKNLNNFLTKFDNYNKNAKRILIGCPPCQGFTSHRKKSWDVEDARNSLVGVFGKIAGKILPDCVIMENVPEMLSGKYWNHFKLFEKELHSKGYIIKKSIYNAAEFGVPQERFRSIVIAMRHDFLLPESLFDKSSFRTVRDAIGHLPLLKAGEKDSFDPFHRTVNHRATTLATIRAVPKNGGSRPKGVGPKCLDKINGFSDVYGRLYWNRPSITITHYARNPASGRYVHPEQDRGLSIREAAYLQGFPKGFYFFGSTDSIYKQIGEAVPPMLSAGIASNIVFEMACLPPTNIQLEKERKQVHEPVSNSFSSVIISLKKKHGVIK